MLLVVGGAEGVAELALVRGGGGPLTGSELGSTIMNQINFKSLPTISCKYFIFLTVFTNQE